MLCACDVLLSDHCDSMLREAARSIAAASLFVSPCTYICTG